MTPQDPQVQWLLDRVAALEKVNERVAVLGEKVDRLQQTTDAVDRQLDLHVEESNKRREQDLKEKDVERASTFRWRVTTLLVVVGTLITATALVLQAISASP